MKTSHPLTEKWRREADLYERRGLTHLATMARSFADELASYETERGLEELSLTQASAESGYSTGHIARLLESGRIANAGEKYSPRVRRKDLPLKAKKIDNSVEG